MELLNLDFLNFDPPMYLEDANLSVAHFDETSGTTSPSFSPSPTDSISPRSAHSPKDKQGNSNRKRNQLNIYQTKVLLKVMERTAFPSRSMRDHLASQLGIPSKSIQIWFQNQRQKSKQQMRNNKASMAVAAKKEQPYQLSPPRYNLQYEPDYLVDMNANTMSDMYGNNQIKNFQYYMPRDRNTSFQGSDWSTPKNVLQNIASNNLPMILPRDGYINPGYEMYPDPYLSSIRSNVPSTTRLTKDGDIIREAFKEAAVDAHGRNRSLFTSGSSSPRVMNQVIVSPDATNASLLSPTFERSMFAYYGAMGLDTTLSDTLW